MPTHHRIGGLFGLRRWLPACAIVCTAAAAAAQGQVWVVGPPGSPGADFEDLPPAVAAASHGDVLIVRPGSYTAFETDKGIAVLAEPGASIAGALTIATSAVTVRDLPAGRTFALRGISLSQAAVSSHLVALERCAGRILLEGVDASAAGAASGIRAVDCDQVWIERCTASGGPAVELIRSHAVVGATHANGMVGVLIPGEAALRVEGGSAVVAQCVLRGGDALLPSPATPPGPAIETLDADLTVTGDAAAELRAGGNHPAPVAAVAGSGGRLRLHPRTTVVANAGAPAIAPAIPWAHVEVPSLSIGPAVLGGRLDITLFGRPGGALALVAALPGPRLNLGALGACWLDPTGPMVMLPVVAHASRYITLGVAIPARAELLGIAVAWQAVEGAPSGGFLLSNPAAYAHAP